MQCRRVTQRHCVGAPCLPLRVYQPSQVCMMLKCITGESLAGAALMHQEDKGHSGDGGNVGQSNLESIDSHS